MARTTVIKLNRLASEPVLTGTDQGSQFVYNTVPADVIFNVDGIESSRRSGYALFASSRKELEAAQRTGVDSPLQQKSQQ